MNLKILIPVAILSFFAVASDVYAQRKSIIDEQVIPGVAVTYGDAVEAFCEQYVFPASLEYKNVGVGRDNCIAERVERDGNKFYFTCRARYSGRLFGHKIGAERVRVYYDNGQIKADLGGCKGAINTKSIEEWMRANNPFERKDLNTRSSLRTFDAAVFHPRQGKVHIFSEEFYYRMDSASTKFEKRAKINSPHWSGVPSDVDAAVLHPRQNKIHFFKADKYYRFDFSEPVDKVDKTGVINQDGWKGVWTDGIDCAVLHPNGSVYFFRDKEYRKFNFDKEHAEGTKKIGIDGWKGLPTNLDCAFEHDGFAYFLKGDVVYKFSFEKGVDRVIDSGPPSKFGFDFK